MPTPKPTPKPTRILTPRLYSPVEIRTTFKIAEQFLRKTTLQALKHRQTDALHITEVKRLILMSICAQLNYKSLYAQTPAARSEAATQHENYSSLLSEYLHPVKELGIETDIAVGRFTIIPKDGRKLTVTSPGLNLTEQMGIRDALIGFIYDWCTKNQGGTKINALMIRELMRPYVRSLFPLAKRSHPLTACIIDRLLIHPQSGLPWNIQIPF